MLSVSIEMIFYILNLINTFRIPCSVWQSKFFLCSFLYLFIIIFKNIFLQSVLVRIQWLAARGIFRFQFYEHRHVTKLFADDTSIICCIQCKFQKFSRPSYPVTITSWENINFVSDSVEIRCSKNKFWFVKRRLL